jgi:hypothetical protein
VNEKQTQFDWKFSVWWLATCTLGTVLGGLVAFTAMWGISDIVSEATNDAVAGLASGLLFGALMALGANLGPGLLLRSKGIDGGRWIGFSTFAGAAGIGSTLTIGFGLTDTLPQAAGMAVIALALGLPVGLAQRLVLRRAGLPANEWPIISTAAYLLMSTVIFASGEGTNTVVWLVLMGVLLGSATAAGFTWLSRQRIALA